VTFADTTIIEGRAFLYNFDFWRFRQTAEETIRPVSIFHCQGVVWKFRYAGQIRAYLNGKLILNIPTDRGADAFLLPVPFVIGIEDDFCIAVEDTEPRWFRWFRPNTAHVTLEGLES
jgi:hypothetical protein